MLQHIALTGQQHAYGYFFVFHNEKEKEFLTAC